MDTTTYIAQGIEPLSDTNFYIPERTCMTKVTNIEVHKTVNVMRDNGSISDEAADYLKIDKPKNPSFYLLLKIHKNILPPPGRPILSVNDSPTKRISAFVDHFLQPYVPLITSFIKDTKDFVRKIESSSALPNEALLVTLGVTSLFTNIPHWEGLSIVHRLLSNKRLVSIKPFNMVKLLSLVLRLNHFEFNDTFWTQKAGVAMGSKSSPSFSNLFMQDFEEKWVYTYHLQPLQWWRYIDDIILIWTHGLDELKKLIDLLNNVHKCIKFTATWSPTEINFLDTTVKVNPDRKLYTTLYTKPTDIHTYLHYNSAHPIHQKKSDPYNQLVRVRRICTQLSDFLDNSKKILSYYAK